MTCFWAIFHSCKQNLNSRRQIRQEPLSPSDFKISLIFSSFLSASVVSGWPKWVAFCVRCFYTIYEVLPYLLWIQNTEMFHCFTNLHYPISENILLGLYSNKNDSNFWNSPRFAQEKLHIKGALTKVEGFKMSLFYLHQTWKIVFFIKF